MINQAKPPRDRRATQATLFLLGATLTTTTILLTRRTIHRRRIAITPQFFPSNARLQFPERMQLEAARVAAGVAEIGTNEVATVVVRSVKGEQLVEGTFLEGMIRPFMPLRGVLPKSVGDWMAGIGKVKKPEGILPTIPKADNPPTHQPTKLPPPTPSPPPEPTTPITITPLSLPLDSPSHLETLHLATITASLHPTLARKRMDSSRLAAEALVLATANVIAFAILLAGGVAIALDIANAEDLKAFALRSIKKAEGVEDEEAERELEEMAKDFLEKFGIQGEDGGTKDAGVVDGRAKTTA